MSVEFKSSYVGKQRVERELVAAMREGLTDNAEQILGEAVRRAPIDTSALRQSGQVEVRHQTDSSTARVFFDREYAAAQHEGDFQHPQGGERYYLATAFKAHALRLHSDIIKAFRRRRLK